MASAKIKELIKNIEEIKTTCSIEDSTNCYELSDHILDNFSANKIDIEDFEILRSAITQNIQSSSCFAYKIRLNYGSRTFNHAFVIIQCSNYFTMCDAWSGIHYLNCREFTNWTGFQKWLNRLINIQNTRDLYSLFAPNPFITSHGNFEEDYETLLANGEYTEKWEDLMSKNEQITNKPKIIIQMVEL